MSEHILDDTDLAGPVCFCLLLGAILLLSGKVHFGYIYGFSMCGCLSLQGIISLMHPIGSFHLFNSLYSWFISYFLANYCCRTWLLANMLCARILSLTSHLPRSHGNRVATPRYSWLALWWCLHCMVYNLSHSFDWCQVESDGAVLVGCLSSHVTVFMFCYYHHLLRCY